MTAGMLRSSAAANARAHSLARAHSRADLRRLAQRRLPRAVFDFIEGGADDETTLRDNRAAFARVRLAPRVLGGSDSIDTATPILGVRAALPIAVGPTGAIGFGWPGADVAIARAAAACGIPCALSTSATASIERIASEAPGRLWFQAYILKKREFTMSLIERARRAGYEALMVTVDLPVGGNRERDFRNDFAVPFRLTSRNLLDFASKPLWALTLLRHGLPVLENLVGLESGSTSTAAVASSVGRNYDPSFNWDDLKAMRDAWQGKFIVKGILRSDDAERAAAIGCDALVVSNHGGRQLDGAPATLDALPAIAAAVGGRMSVLVDGGIRRGADIVKALSLGAEAVLIGRATLYGVCAAGEAGAALALQILSDELVRTMQLCGARCIAEIGPDLALRESR